MGLIDVSNADVFVYVFIFPEDKFILCIILSIPFDPLFEGLSTLRLIKGLSLQFVLVGGQLQQEVFICFEIRQCILMFVNLALNCEDLCVEFLKGVVTLVFLVLCLLLLLSFLIL